MVFKIGPSVGSTSSGSGVHYGGLNVEMVASVAWHR